MGILDSLREALGMAAEADATRAADPEDLFGLSTAYVTMEAELDYVPGGEAALCFSGVDSTAFAAARDEVDAVLHAGKDETGTRFEFRTDGHGYDWVVLADDDFEDLVTGVHFAADTMIEAGFGSRLLAAVFAFERETPSASRAGRTGSGSGGERSEPSTSRTGEAREPATRETQERTGDSVYWLYSFRRGSYYPFAPKPGRQRDSSAEFKLESVMDGELGIESDKSYWYPLWPEGDARPWGSPLASG